MLDLGCAQGANLCFLAATYPNSEFVGIDLSERQIATGQAVAEACGLSNVTLLARDLSTGMTDLGAFDYVICHGVFSWVPRVVQRATLDLCRSSLTQGGVAFVSYKTYPGWAPHRALRELLLDSTGLRAQPHHTVATLRVTLSELLGQLAADEPAGMLLAQAIEGALGRPDEYLAHEYLDAVDDAMFVTEFAAQVNDAGLTYLDDAVVLDHRWEPWIGPENLRRQLRHDIIVNTAFRGAVLCREDAAVGPTPNDERLSQWYVGASVSPPRPTNQPGTVEFTDRHGSIIRVRSSPLADALETLGRVWPRSVPISSLDVEPQTVGTLFGELARLHRLRTVEISREPFPVAPVAGERPEVSPVARWAACVGSTVATQRHDSLLLDDILRLVTQRLDGEHTVMQIVDELAPLAASGELVVSASDGRELTREDEQRQRLERMVPRAIEILSDRGMFAPS